ncbi:MAG: hypothetical protein ABI704_10100 [Kofleriaceae bacterium]
MSRRYWGTLYFVKPGLSNDSENASESVVDTYRNGPSDLAVAMELWALSGHRDRADRIRALLDTANERENPILAGDEVRSLIESLEGIESAARSLGGDDGVLRPEQLSPLLERSKLLDLDNTPGHAPEYAVIEALSRVQALRNALADAHARNLDVALD